MSEFKQMIIVRKDLNMRKGKMIAQGAHASFGALLSVMDRNEDRDGDFLTVNLRKFPPLKQWLDGRFTKICVSCNSEQELIDLYEKAKTAGLICSIITDAGLTEFGGVPTKTAVAIGPAFPEDVDPITSHLSLL